MKLILDKALKYFSFEIRMGRTTYVLAYHWDERLISWIEYSK